MIGFVLHKLRILFKNYLHSGLVTFQTCVQMQSQIQSTYNQRQTTLNEREKEENAAILICLFSEHYELIIFMRHLI